MKQLPPQPRFPVHAWDACVDGGGVPDFVEEFGVGGDCECRGEELLDGVDVWVGVSVCEKRAESIHNHTEGIMHCDVLVHRLYHLETSHLIPSHLILSSKMKRGTSLPLFTTLLTSE